MGTRPLVFAEKYQEETVGECTKTKRKTVLGAWTYETLARRLATYTVMSAKSTEQHTFDPGDQDMGEHKS